MNTCVNSIVGVGYIYYGDEINLPGETDAGKSKDFANANYARIMQWTMDTTLGFTANTSHNFTGANTSVANAMVQENTLLFRFILVH